MTRINELKEHPQVTKKTTHDDYNDIENVNEVRQRVKKRAEFAEKFKSTTAEDQERLMQAAVKEEEEKKAKQKILRNGKKASGGVRFLCPIKILAE